MASITASPAQRELLERCRVNWLRMYDTLMAEGMSRKDVAMAAGIDSLRYYHHRAGAHPGLQVCLGMIIASEGRWTFQNLLNPVDVPLPERKTDAAD